MARQLIFCLASCLLLGLISCQCRKEYRVYQSDVSKNILKPCNEAYLIDVSLPWGVQGYDISDKEQSGNIVITYKSIIAFDAVYNFHMLDMEQQGWICSRDISAQGKKLLLFEKPLRYCMISIEERYPEVSTTLFICQKELQS